MTEDKDDFPFNKEDMARTLIRLAMRNCEQERTIRRLIAGKHVEDDDEMMKVVERVMEQNSDLLARPEMADGYNEDTGFWLDDKYKIWICKCDFPGDRRSAAFGNCSACGALAPPRTET